MPIYAHGSGSGRKAVKIEVHGSQVTVIEKAPDGSTKRGQRDWQDEARARRAAEKMGRELVARGFVEQVPPPKSATPVAKPPEPTGIDVGALLEDDEEPVDSLLPRITAPVATPHVEPKSTKKKKKTGKKKRKKAGASGDNMEKKATVAIFGMGVVLALFVTWFVYDGFFKPPSIVGGWKGSKLEYEVSRSLSKSEFALVLDASKRASVVQDGYAASGTYKFQKNRLDLALKDEDGNSFDLHYKVVLGRSTMDLYDLQSGEKTVQLIRQSHKASSQAPAPAAPAAPELTEAPAAGDAAADGRLASVDFSPKDQAFRLRHPTGWKPETGSRPDNTYSWARFTQGSAKIQVFADVAGSLMSGSDSARQVPEGSELAPVHGAHQMALKTAKEEFSDYSESKPVLFKGSALGEGRIATFQASAGGLFGGKLRGYRVTLLTRNRRVTILCSCPEAEFSQLEPTFLAVCRSVSR